MCSSYSLGMWCDSIVKNGMVLASAFYRSSGIRATLKGMSNTEVNVVIVSIWVPVVL